MKTQTLPSFIEEEMQRSYLDYAMSVIVGRALPDVRDGLKPVHRRILYAMKIGGYESNKPHKKSARVVGDVMSQFHPHGDSAIYDAMVRMAQLFSMRLPLIDGQGNFGSVDGDPPAAMRYTEARLMPVAEAILVDTDQHTVKFRPNYDESTTEPTVLASRVPNLMVNGSSGIAVGMATNIPPHNLGEVVDGCCALIDNPELSSADLLQYVHGPDFPTGAMIMGRKGISEAYRSGRGSIILRARTNIEEPRKDRMAVVITEIPYQVNKARMLARMGEAVNNKIISGIADIRDESDRDGLRVVIELKRDAVPEVVRNQLFRHTQLQTTFAVNTLALRDGRPELLDLRTALSSFLVFREQVIRLRSEHELEKAHEQAHLLIGFAVTVDNLDSMIELIRHSSDSSAARKAILDKRWEIGQAQELIDEQPTEEGYCFSDIQARAILELRLNRLTSLEREKNADALRQITQRIDYYQDILEDRSHLLELMRDELLEIKQRFGNARRSEIVGLEQDDDLQLGDEDLIPREDMVVTVSRSGYIKRVSLSSYRSQRRGGKGRSGMRVLSEDAVAELFIASTHDRLLLLSTRGWAYLLKGYKLPFSAPQSSGKSLRNLLPLIEGERISATLVLPETHSDHEHTSVVFATANGYVRRNRLADFSTIRSNGLMAMKLQDNDRLISAIVCQEPCDVLLATRRGRCIRFPLVEKQLRVFSGRSSSGVRGVRLVTDDDEVISLSSLRQVKADNDERASYLKVRNEIQKRADAQPDKPPGHENLLSTLTPSPAQLSGSLTRERYLQLAEQEELILTVSERGFGKLSSAYEYRTSARGGQGIWSMRVSARVGSVAAAIFPVSLDQEIMLATEHGQLIRMPVQGLRIAGRSTSGVRLFRIDEQECIVSVAITPPALEEETVD